MSLKEKLGLDSDPVFLMDGTAFIYRSFFAQRHLKRSDGFPTNALTLLARALLRILRLERPKHFLFVTDGKGGIEFRKAIYAQYKANRESMPEELRMQIEPVMRMVAALGLPTRVAPDCEADDCIASLAAKFAPDYPVIIISGDKDLKQCLGPGVYMWDPRDDKITSDADFLAEEGAKAQSWADMQALIGDSSDNIPGVQGIGPKTARQIFQICENLEDIRDNLSKLPPKIQDKLKPNLEQMFTWRELTRLRRDKCGDLSLPDLAPRPINVEACAAIAREFEMSTVGREAARLACNAGLEAPEAPRPAGKARKTWPLAARFVVARENLPPCADQPVALIWPDNVKAPCRVALPGQEEFEWRGGMADLCAWLAACARVIVPDYKLLLASSPSWRHLRHDAPSLAILDLGLSSWLLDPDDGDYAFPRLALRWEENLGSGEDGPATLALKMGDALQGRLEKENLQNLYAHLEIPLAPVLAQMQLNGFAIDPAAFKRFLDDVQGELDGIIANIYKTAGFEFNLRSSRQLAEALYGRMGLPAPRLTAGGQQSTSQATLEKFAPDYPVVDYILQFRKLDKMRSTYLDPLPRLMDAHGRIHSTFNQEATATGRISSSDPNLQNIPVRGALGKRMRACFVADKGNLLVAADYSQIELRVLAHLSQDESLLAAFRDGDDIHARTAALVFERAAHEISADERRMAKTINFGLLYGMGARKLGQELHISALQAKDFIDRYFAKLSGLRRLYDQILEHARQKGFVQTMAGRKRWLPGINSENGQARAQAERQAVNSVTQGSAADIVKLAMLAVASDPELARMGARLTLQVHDELLLEAPEEHAHACGERLAQIMRQVRPGGVELSVPLLADWGVGHNWAQAH